MGTQPTSMLTYGSGWVNPTTGSHYHKDAAGQMVKIGVVPRWKIVALLGGIEAEQIEGIEGIDALAAAYQVPLAPSMAALIAARSTRTEDICAVLQAIYRFQRLALMTDPVEQQEHREWLWAALKGLIDEPVWAYEMAQSITGIVLDPK